MKEAIEWVLQNLTSAGGTKMRVKLYIFEYNIEISFVQYHNTSVIVRGPVGQILTGPIAVLPDRPHFLGL